MGLETVETGVDELMRLLEKSGKIQLSEAAKQLKLPVNVIQAWVDFLVEERMVGVEYKFTVPYIYINKKTVDQKNVIITRTMTINDFKTDFFEKAKVDRIPEQQIPKLWHNHVVNSLSNLKPLFYREAKKRGFTAVEPLWQDYAKKMIT